MNNALSYGAMTYRSGGDSSGWRSMESAPRDGTVVEIKCSYGVAPWYGLFKWDHSWGEGRWTSPDGMSGVGNNSIEWRPYAGDVATYTDPTGGVQNDMAYWRGAVAAKYGLPPDHFEEQVERNERRNAGIKWWQFWK